MGITGSHGSTIGLAGVRREASTRPGRAVPALTILHHPDLSRVGEVALLAEIVHGGTARLGRLTPELAAPGSPAGRPLADQHISREPLELSEAPENSVRITVGTSRTRVEADGVPIEREALFSRERLVRGVVLELAERIVLLLHWRTSLPSFEAETFGLVGASEGIARVRFDIRQVADLDVPVLVRGDTGTGKELVAHAVHTASRRRSGPFLGVNIGSIPPSLAASELFGAVRGAFTGAVEPRAGFFRRAHGGTLFLDEIGEVSGEVQAMLLRVLETGELYSVGSQSAQRVDVRVLAATDSNLEARARTGDFRAPLLHRLGGYVIWLPPLTERREDFGRLFHHFLAEELARVAGSDESHGSQGNGERIPAALVARLARHDWPGNVRQLRNVARQLVIANRGRDRIEVTPAVNRLLAETPTAISGAARASGATPPRPLAPLALRKRRGSEIPDAEVESALRAHRFDLQAAATELGISRPSLYERIAAHPTLRTASDLSAAEISAAFAECDGDLDAMVDRLEVSPRALGRRLREMGLLPRGAPEAGA
ncbi:MAG TPA: sigma 54-interacting transcriptional regulator [Thermoanaerobaculia bacterium]|nr:sigma 54-interacting transcriptional regulator [Thermoanaerobaculia bacterium]